MSPKTTEPRLKVSQGFVVLQNNIEVKSIKNQTNPDLKLY